MKPYEEIAKEAKVELTLEVRMFGNLVQRYALIDYWDCEEYFLQNSVRISPNTTIKLKYKGE
jgi:hypothetical protein